MFIKGRQETGQNAPHQLKKCSQKDIEKNGHKNGKKVTGEAKFTFLGGLVTATGSIGATPPDSGCSEFHHQLFYL